MKITEIVVSYKRTMNLGNFNNAVFEESISAELEDGDNETQCVADLWRHVKASIQAQALPVVRPRQEALDAAWNSLPDEVKEAILANRI